MLMHAVYRASGGREGFREDNERHLEDHYLHSVWADRRRAVCSHRLHRLHQDTATSAQTILLNVPRSVAGSSKLPFLWHKHSHCWHG